MPGKASHVYEYFISIRLSTMENGSDICLRPCQRIKFVIIAFTDAYLYIKLSIKGKKPHLFIQCIMCSYLFGICLDIGFVILNGKFMAIKLTQVVYIYLYPSIVINVL